MNRKQKMFISKNYNRSTFAPSSKIELIRKETPYHCDFHPDTQALAMSIEMLCKMLDAVNTSKYKAKEAFH